MLEKIRLLVAKASGGVICNLDLELNKIRLEKTLFRENISICLKIENAKCWYS